MKHVYNELGAIKTNQLRRYRKRRSLLQSDVASLMGVNQSNDVYRWEIGRKLPTLVNALKLSAILQCPIEILFLDHFNHIRDEVRRREESLKKNH